jgi:segregation and condensation protein A
MSDYRVDLDIFAGPLDLLLYLVRKEEVDIYDIPISRITQQYIQYLEMLKMLDIDLAGDFLVMAATLMEIKSAMILPKSYIEEQSQEQGGGDPRAELVRQLLEYKKFKDAANLLQDAAEERQLRFTRSNYILEKVKPQQEPEIDLDQVSIWTLLEAFDAILKATGNVNHRYDHIKDDTPIDLYQIELLHRLQTEGPMTLQKTFEGKTNRLVLIGLFMAMLELIRNHLIWAEQPQMGGPVYLKPLTTEPAEQAVQNAIYSNPEAMEQKPPHSAEFTDASEPASEESGDSETESFDTADEDELPDDDFSKELAAIDVPPAEEAPATGRIPIIDIPSKGTVQTKPPVLEETTESSETSS